MDSSQLHDETKHLLGNFYVKAHTSPAVPWPG